MGWTGERKGLGDIVKDEIVYGEGKNYVGVGDLTANIYIYEDGKLVDIVAWDGGRLPSNILMQLLEEERNNE